DVRTASETRYEVGNIGVLPDVNPVVPAVESRWPAEAAGLRVGDIVVAIDGRRVVTPAQVIEAVNSAQDSPLELTVRRGQDGTGEQDLTRQVTPRFDEALGRWRLGFAPGEQTRTFEPGPLEAIQLSIARNIEVG